jgi:hypothetical protein
MGVRRQLPFIVVALLGIAACGSAPTTAPGKAVGRAASEGAPVVVRDARDARVAVRGEHVVRPLVFDGGALRIDPARGHPRVSEQQAIRYVRAASLPGSAILVSDVVVALGIVTLTTPVTSQGMVVVGSRTPSFTGRPAWFVVYENSAHSCPAMRAPAPSVPAHALREPLPVRLVAADGSGEGVTYAGAGAFCGGAATPPTAHPSVYDVSVPWHILNGAGGSLQLKVDHLPPCSAVSGASGPGWPDTSVAVGAEVVMAAGTCPPAASSVITVGKTRDGSEPRHAPTGLASGMLTDFDPAPGAFSYFDGARHVVK